MSELLQLLEHEIPEGRQNLQENFKNLEQVAQYCQENYLQVKYQIASGGWGNQNKLVYNVYLRSTYKINFSRC